MVAWAPKKSGNALGARYPAAKMRRMVGDL